MSFYASGRAERDGWILTERGARAILNPEQPYGYFIEDERDANGQIVPVATVLLTNRECPWRCVMCDLWKNTLTASVERGAIPAQIDFALSRLAQARHIKLYNSGSFFDKGAIPMDDYPAIADRLQSFERVIVESHPALVGESTLRFRDLLPGRLEVAVGLETAHREVLQKLNKGMTLQHFSKAARTLRHNDIAMRTFILVQPPFLPPREALFWAERSLDFAFDDGAAVATLIPTRAGNGAMDSLAATGDFIAPRIQTLEAALEYGIGLRRGRVFADLWDLRKTLSSCAMCFEARVARLRAINLAQALLPAVECLVCRGDG